MGRARKAVLRFASVVCNRARQRGLLPSQVVLEPNQFEPWDNAETARGLMAIRPDDPLYQEVAAQIACDQDPTGGASHFYAPKAQAALGRPKPAWDDGTGRAIGNHLFFNLDGQPADDVQLIGQPQNEDFSAFEVVDAMPEETRSFVPQLGARDNPIDITNRNQVIQAKKGDWVRLENDDLTRAAGSAVEGTTDEQRAPGIFTRTTNLGDAIGAGAMAAAEQIPFLDESVAFTTGLLSGEGYQAMRDRQEALKQIDNEQNRGARIAGGVAGFGSTLLLPGVASSGRYVASGANRIERARRAAQVGGAGGALFGVANTDGDLADRAQAGAAGGLLGVAAGPIANEVAGAVPGLLRRGASGVSEAGSRLSRGVGSQPKEQPVTPQATESALEYVRGLLSQSGRDIATDPIAALGKPITAAEAMGRTGINQMTALSRRSGQAGDMAADVLSSRAVEQSGRILDDLAAAFGFQTGAAEDAISAIARQSREAARPLYEAAYRAQNVDSPALRDLMSRPSAPP